LSRRLSVILLLASIAVAVGAPLWLLAAEPVDGYFSLAITANGEDLSTLDTIAVNPDEELVIEMHVFDVTGEVILESISVTITCCGLQVGTITRGLGNRHIEPGGEYTETMVINPEEAFSIGDMPIATGLYRGLVEVSYSVGGQRETFSQPKNIHILGNPATTLVGTVAIATTAAAAASATILGISLAGLRQFALGRLEPTARGNVVGAITRAARKRVKKRYCPICSSRIKHDYCYTCQKTFKEVEKEYTEKVKELAMQGNQLLASGEVETIDALCSRLGISDRLAMDVVATLKDARLVRVKGIASRLMTKAVTAGISSAISLILWLTIGGFAVLGTYLLITILVLAILIPILITKFFQWRARRGVG
jgi:hypothetical protein